jgi:hypothetical protein
VFNLRFFTKIFVLHQCLDPNLYSNPNFFRIRIRPKVTDSDSDAQHRRQQCSFSIKPVDFSCSLLQKERKMVRFIGIGNDVRRSEIPYQNFFSPFFSIRILSRLGLVWNHWNGGKIVTNFSLNLEKYRLFVYIWVSLYRYSSLPPTPRPPLWSCEFPARCCRILSCNTRTMFVILEKNVVFIADDQTWDTVSRDFRSSFFLESIPPGLIITGNWLNYFFCKWFELRIRRDIREICVTQRFAA